MDLENHLALSYYKDIAAINQQHKVSLVQHRSTNKIYVKKVLDIYNEKVYQQLQAHPIEGLPKIKELVVDQGQLIVIEEYISGETLKEKMDQAELEQSDILPYMLNLCDIVGNLHKQIPPIIHRDIKPSNLIITDYNKIILLDFNAAKQFHATSETDTVLLGTQGYAAPEQYGFGSSTPQTDIYSLGVILKEMLLSSGLQDGSLSAISEKCRQLNPDDRYHTVSDLKEALSQTKQSGHTSGAKENMYFKKNTYSKDDKVFTDDERSLNVKVQTNFHSFLPPGFRTKTPWKILVSSMTYIFITWLCMSLDLKNVYGATLWVERFFILIIFLAIIFITFNYRNVQYILPICKSKNRLIRVIGVVLLNVIVFFFLFMIMMILEGILQKL